MIILLFEPRVMRWAGHVKRIRGTRGAYRVLVGKSQGKRPLRRPRRRWDDDIKTGLKQIDFDGVDWIDLIQNRDTWRAVVNTVTNLQIYKMLGYFLTR
jgi:hypothetical protein